MEYLDPDTPHPVAAQLLGIPFCEGGRDYRAFVGGTDCLGLTLEFLHRIGIYASDPWEHERKRWLEGADRTAQDVMRDAWRPLSADESVQVGDVGEMNGGRHVCVYVGGEFVLHAAVRRDSFLMSTKQLEVSRWWRWSGC